MIEVKDYLLKALLNLEEQDKENDKLFKLLYSNIEDISYTSTRAYIAFSNGQEAILQLKDTHYTLTLIDHSHYLNEDDHNSKMSLDRILLYLKHLCDLPGKEVDYERDSVGC